MFVLVWVVVIFEYIGFGLGEVCDFSCFVWGWMLDFDFFREIGDWVEVN